MCKGKKLQFHTLSTSCRKIAYSDYIKKKNYFVKISQLNVEKALPSNFKKLVDLLLQDSETQGVPKIIILKNKDYNKKSLELSHCKKEARS